MNPDTAPAHDDDLGGRLPLLAPTQLDEQQRRVYDALTATVVPEATQSGYTARLDDGRFIGPFNAMLRTPTLSEGFGQWTSRIAQSDMPADVRQIVILTVGTFWDAAFEIDAHVSAARAIGIAEDAVQAIVHGTTPSALNEKAALAHRLAKTLLQDHRLAPELYGEAIAAFGEPGLIGILSLIGQYQMISTLLVTFEVPVPAPHRTER